MTKVQIIAGDFNIIDPAWPRYDITRPVDVLISDGFTSDGWLGGQDTDSALGGKAATWINAQYVTEAWQVIGGQAVWNKPGTVYLIAPQPDCDLEVTIDALPASAADTVNGQARRTATTSHYVSAVVRGNGEVTLKTYDGTSIAESDPAGKLLAPGDGLALRVVSGSASILINGETVITKAVGEWPSDRLALNSSSASGAKLGSLKVLAR